MVFTDEFAPWRAQLNAALEAHPLHHDYALATSGAGDKRPRVRHVTHQGFSPSGLLLLATDRATNKFRDIKENHFVEVAWYIPGTQFRIRGRAVVVSELNEFRAAGMMHKYLPLRAPESGYKYWAHERERIWRALPKELAHSYDHNPPNGEQPPPGVDNAHYNFVMIAIVPKQVEVLELAEKKYTTYVQDQPGGKWIVVPDENVNTKKDGFIARL